MPITLEQAKATTQAITFDVWNNVSRAERMAMLEKFCSPKVEAYAPDGSKTVGIEDVRCRPLFICPASDDSPSHTNRSADTCGSAMVLTTNSMLMDDLLGSSSLVAISG